MIEILNMGPCYGWSNRNAIAKASKPQAAESIDGIKIVGRLCQQVSKLNLTLVRTDIAGEMQDEDSVAERIKDNGNEMGRVH
jgi:hypothetical protein